MLITVIGRKTGRRTTIPVGYLHAEDAIVILVGEAPKKRWWRNYLNGGPIELNLRGEVVHAHAQVVPADTAEFGQRAEASFKRSRMIPRIFGIDFDARAGLSRAQIEKLAREAAIVRVTLEDK